MSYSYPTLPVSKSNSDPASRGLTTTQHWADIDANTITGSIKYTIDSLNAVSGGLDSVKTFVGYPSAPAWNLDFSNVWIAISGTPGTPRPNWPIGIAQALYNLSQTFVNSDLPANAVSSGALNVIDYAFFGSRDQSAVSSSTAAELVTRPTATYYNLRGNYYTLSGNLNNSASNWNSSLGNFSALSSNLDVSMSRMNAMSSTLDVSASKWNAASSSYHTLSQSLDLSSSKWNTVSSTLSAVLNADVTLTPSSYYIKAPNGIVWVVTIGNDGVLSTNPA